MPRPRSSTFYLPLAPIDAPLELKAKLSVLPPSAANALLAPRNHGGCGGGFGFSRSTATTANGTSSSINHGHTINPNNGNGNGFGSSCPGMAPQEDECTRLNRVLGIPTTTTPSTTQHTHIALPESPNRSSTFNSTNSSSSSSNSTTSNLNVPSSAGIARRRHTDAPKPSFPIPRVRVPTTTTTTATTMTRSPLLPTPVPSDNSGTGYFSTWGNADWKPAPSFPSSPSTAPGLAPGSALTSTAPGSESTSTSQLPTPSLSGLPSTAPMTALSPTLSTLTMTALSLLPSESQAESQAERVSPSPPGLPSLSETGSSASAFIPDGPQTALTDNDRVSEEDGNRAPNDRVKSQEDPDCNGGDGGCETEVSMPMSNGMMAWTSDAADVADTTPSADTSTPSDGADEVGEWNMGTPIVEAGPGVQVGHGAVNMDMFAGACEVRNPVVQREVDTPRVAAAAASSTSSISTVLSASVSRRTPSPLPTTTTTPSSSLPLPTRTTPPTSTTTPVQVRPAPTPTPTPLSYIPCGMHHVLACRTKVRSRFAPSPPQSRGSSRPSTSASSRPCTAVHSSRPSTSSSIISTSTSTSTTSSTTSTSTSTTSSSTSIILTSKITIRPPPCDSLHPNDTRHLLRPQFRLSFPPPPPPTSLASTKDTHPREEACMFVDESIPGLADINATFVSSGGSGGGEHHDQESTSRDSIRECQQPAAAVAAAAKIAPRQRFRLAPSYLPKVLRRSLGASAWARAETLRAARAIECGFGGVQGGFGWGAPGMMNGAVPLNFHTGAGAWPAAFATLDGMGQGGPNSSTGGAWWQSGANGQPGCSFGSSSSSLVWSGYEDVYSEEADEDMEIQDGDEMKEESIWDWDDEDVEPVMVQGQERQAMDEDEFVREGAPEPEERPSPQSSPSYSIQTPSTPSDPEIAGYSMVGKFGWDTTWPASPTFPVAPAGGETTHLQSIDIPGIDVAPIPLGLPPVHHRRTVRREDGAEEDEDEEEIFRYSPLKVEEDQGLHERMDVEGDVEDVQADYLHTQSMSSCSTPTATSPSFPPGPLRGVAISSSFDDGYLVERAHAAEQAEDNQEFYDADGDAEMEEAPVRNILLSRPPIRAPRPLSLVQHPVLHHQYHEDASSPPPSSVFIIPPSPLTTTTFDTDSGTGSSTPTSATAPMFPDRMEEEGDLSNVGWPTTSVEHSLSPKRSYERIVAPRPQRVSRALEQVFTASTSSPVYRTSSLAQSPPLPGSPPSASSPRWTFGSLKSALSNSMSHLVELARSRSPSPLPWLMRGSAGHTGATLSGVAAALDSHRQSGSEEELESERSTSCVTPTPAAGSHSRRSSTTTITGASTSRRAEASSSAAHLPVLKLQVDPTSADAMMSESPPPKRTLSTSSLSSLGSEPDSESGSSGGIFSRSPSPEPTSDTRIWDPSYTLTPRSRPISADAKAAAACGGRLSPMMIPGSWDPAELWAEEGDLAKTW